MLGDETVGTCSICGGAVTVPRVFWSVVPPVPTCSRCGATAAQHGPVIPMQPARPAYPSTGIEINWTHYPTSTGSIDLREREAGGTGAPSVPADPYGGE